MLSTEVENTAVSSDSRRSNRLALKPASAALDFSFSKSSRVTTVRSVARTDAVPPGQLMATFAAPRPVKQLMNRSTVAAEPLLLKPPLLKPMPQFAYQVHSVEGFQLRLTFGWNCEKVRSRGLMTPDVLMTGSRAAFSGALPTKALSNGL